VIRNGEDRQIPQETPLLESVEDAPDHGVHVRGLGVVEALQPLGGPGREALQRRPVFRRRPVAAVRVVEVDPQEEGPPRAALAQPAQRLVGRLVGGSLRVSAAPLRLPGARVDVEPLIEAEARVEHVGGDEGGRVVAGLREDLGQRLRLLGQRHSQEVPQPVLGRQEAGEHAGVGGPRVGRGGHRLREAQRLASEGVEPRCLRERAVVAAERIDAGGIEREQEDIGSLRRAPAGEERRQQEHGEDSDHSAQQEHGEDPDHSVQVHRPDQDSRSFFQSFFRSRVNATAGFSQATIQSPRSISASSWPGAQPV